MTASARTRPQATWSLGPEHEGNRRPGRPPATVLTSMADHVPRPRRAPVVIMAVAGVGVTATSFGSLPVGALAALSAAWCLFLAAVALWPGRGGRVALTVTSSGIKVLTVVLVVWAISHPHSQVGPHTVGDWVPLGLLNAGSGGFWLRRVVFRQAK